MFDEIMITLDPRSPFLAKHPVFIRIYVICTKFSMHTVPTYLGTGIHTSTSGYNCGIIYSCKYCRSTAVYRCTGTVLEWGPTRVLLNFSTYDSCTSTAVACTKFSVLNLVPINYIACCSRSSPAAALLRYPDLCLLQL
jgi:hypothetical protein